MLSYRRGEQLAYLKRTIGVFITFLLGIRDRLQAVEYGAAAPALTAFKDLRAAVDILEHHLHVPKVKGNIRKMGTEMAAAPEEPLLFADTYTVVEMLHRLRKITLPVVILPDITLRRKHAERIILAQQRLFLKDGDRAAQHLSDFS